MTTLHTTPHIPLGSTVDELDTPTLCLDWDLMLANMAAVARTCRERGVAWRPHCKGHKVAAIGQAEIEAGALGITCAKLAEAEIMAAGGISDLLVANMIVGPQKLARLVELRRRADVMVCADHADHVDAFSAAFRGTGMTLRVLVETDIGLERVGIQPGEPALELARRIDRSPGLVLAGIMGYEGHLLRMDDLDEKRRAIKASLDLLGETKQQLEKAGLPCGIVSCGATGSYLISTEHPAITEVQAGGAIFMDAFYRDGCQVPDLDFALTVVATVVSRPTPERAIIDAGRKTLNIEIHPPLVAGRDDIRVVRLSAEHGQLELAPSAQNLKIGDRVTLIPGYADLTAVLHDDFYVFRDGRLAEILPIEGRGKLR